VRVDVDASLDEGVFVELELQPTAKVNPIVHVVVARIRRLVALEGSLS
jgi:hypothetical protein